MTDQELSKFGERANIGPRFLATVIDVLLSMLITVPLTLSIYPDYLNSERFIEGPADLLINWVAPVIIVVLFWLYKEATPGKIIMKLRVIDRNSGQTISLGQAIVRYLGYLVSLLPFGLGYLWIAFDERREAWHDKLADTIVVKSPN
jgi:uncharacterized RDD family membrane protein YckC